MVCSENYTRVELFQILKPPIKKLWYEFLKRSKNFYQKIKSLTNLSKLSLSDLPHVLNDMDG